MVGDGAGDGGPRARARCGVGLLRGSVATTTLLGTGASPRLLEEKPDGQVQAGSVSSACVLSPAPALVLVLKQKPLLWVLDLDLDMGVGAWPQAAPQAAPAALPVVSVRNGCLRLLRCFFRSQLPWFLIAKFSVWPQQSSPQKWRLTCIRKQEDPEWSLSSGQGTRQGGCGKLTSTSRVSVHTLCSALGVGKHVHTSYKQNPGFP